MEPTGVCHVAALPFPGRGHINPMMNVCKQLSSRKPEIQVTFVVTEEWLGLIGSEPKPDNVVFATVPNVIPSEHGRADDFPGFIEAVMSTNLAAPFEELLDRLEPPPSAILADSLIVWVNDVGNRRNIPVASLCSMSASVFSVFHHFELLKQNRHFPVNLSERGHELVDYIPGISTTRLVDLTIIFHGDKLNQVLSRTLKAVCNVPKAQYLLFTSFYELESQAFDSLKTQFPFPIYPIGPSIPHFQLETSPSNNNVPNYIQWLDSQPKGSVLYISLGSFLSVSSPQLGEIFAGVTNSGARYLWVSRVKVGCDTNGNGNGNGFVVSWYDQLRVLCHPSIGAFWTHCGWNSILEAVFGGVPMLTFPITWGQVLNRKRIVDDWKIGCTVRKDVLGSDCNESLVTREEISEIVTRFMDSENSEGIAMRKRAKELQEACRCAIAKGGSSYANLDAFIRDISQCGNG